MNASPGRTARDWSGTRVGKVLVIERAAKPATRSLSATRETWWLCSCNCGRETVMGASRLQSGAKACRCK